MVDAHYGYLVLKMPRPVRVICVLANFFDVVNVGEALGHFPGHSVWPPELDFLSQVSTVCIIVAAAGQEEEPSFSSH